jgi:hypothetical protein
MHCLKLVPASTFVCVFVIKRNTLVMIWSALSYSLSRVPLAGIALTKEIFGALRTSAEFRRVSGRLTDALDAALFGSGAAPGAPVSA